MVSIEPTVQLLLSLGSRLPVNSFNAVTFTRRALVILEVEPTSTLVALIHRFAIVGVPKVGNQIADNSHRKRKRRRALNSS